MTFENSDPEVVMSNGQSYLAGYDDSGYFTIQMVVLLPVEEAINSKGEDTITHKGDEYIAKPEGVYPNTSFPPGKAERIAELIQENKP